MDPELQRRAQARAAALGISFAEYVRRLVEQHIGQPKPKIDVAAVFDLVKDGPVTDIARDKDKLIGEALWQNYLRKVGRLPKPAAAKRRSAAKKKTR